MCGSFHLKSGLIKLGNSKSVKVSFLGAPLTCNEFDELPNLLLVLDKGPRRFQNDLVELFSCSPNVGCAIKHKRCG